VDVRTTAAGLAYAVGGDREGVPLLLLHGFTGARESFAHLLPFLAGRPLLLPDLPGHGGSQALAADLWQTAELLVGLMDEADVPTADVLGYSLGGRVALHLALLAPQRVRRLVLESASPGLRQEEARRARREADEALAARILEEGVPAFVRHWEALPLFAGVRRLPAEVQSDLRRIRLAQTAEGLASSLRLAGQGAQEPLWARLATIRQPTLVLVGEEDRRYREEGREMVAALPAARLVVVPGVGHTVHLEAPSLFLTHVLAFLDRPQEPIPERSEPM
jgi:2-succinyl-6-hydroxy-2,4-cyclohexadiene-1-carboxylate synthase